MNTRTDALPTPHSLLQPLTRLRLHLAIALLLCLAGLPVAAQTPAPKPAPAPAPSPAAPAPRESSPQPAANPPPPTGAPVVTRAALTAPPLTDLAAQALIRVALTDLRANPRPTVEDYSIALTLMRQAIKLQPTEPEFVRLAIDAADQAGEPDASEELLRALVNLDPQDTVAQLSLIASRINRLQDFQARLTAYDNFLGPKGQSLDPSIRSRLALDAALLHRERGDIKAFVARLTEAVQLDSTNKDAAALAYAFFTSRVSSDSGRLELLINLLNADPLDRETHLSIARQLAAVGASAQAVRFYKNTMTIDEKYGDRITLELSTERSIAQWAADGASATVKELNRTIRDTRTDIASLRRQMEDAKRPIAELPDPANIRLDLATERLRATAAAAAGDAETLKESIKDMALSVAALDEYIAKPDTLPKRMTLERAEFLRRLWRVDLPLTFLIVGERVDDAERKIEALQADAKDPVPPEALSRLLGWLKLRKGDLDAAQAELAKAGTDDAAAALGFAVLAELKGDNTLAAERYASVWRGSADSYLGAYARSKAAALTGKPPPPAAIGDQLDAMAAGIPTWVDDACKGPRTFLAIVTATTASTYGPLDPIKLTIKLRNQSPVPMRLSEDGPLNTRMLLAPAQQIGSARERGLPEVIRLDRRLRLQSREELSVTTWADPGYGGWLMENLSGMMARIQWRVVQGFILKDETTVPGPYSFAVDFPSVTRDSLRGLNTPVPELAELIRTGKDAEFAQSIAVAQVRLRTVGAEGGLGLLEAKPLIDALTQRYEAEGTPGRLLILLRIPKLKATAAFDESLSKVTETDDGVTIAKLIARVDDPASPLLTAAAKGSPLVARIAKLHEARLKAGAKVFANMDGIRLADATKKVEDEAKPDAPAKPDTAKPADPAKTPPATPATTNTPPMPPKK